ncbi:hypothetical protein B0H17DRAFT_1221124 [Mycena rosella]|uniref:Reverse transcriptase zinc-binding domain-containing protein n=1 Tax=Mycena rosella TaxID=1033263 RepID=A0AAD7FC81_MYCRO|nr:hypothetical protein B0H17DRAFT_1221124 [Mycena rosella]
MFVTVRDTVDRPSCKATTALAPTAAAENIAVKINLSIPAGVKIRRAKLSKMAQVKAYHKIRSLKETPTRKTTESTIALIQDFEKACTGHAPTPERIWESVRHKDITRQIKSWLWKSLHGAHRIGHYWTHIPGFEERTVCRHCGEPESLQHILIECPNLGQARIWGLANELWRGKSGSPLPTPSMGMILGSALTIFENESRMKLSGLNRLYQILISESAFLIWKLRNESVIMKDGAAPSVHEVHNRWVSLMNERLKIDQFMLMPAFQTNLIVWHLSGITMLLPLIDVHSVTDHC